MAANVLVRPLARRDIVEQALYIAEDSPEAADRFLESAEGTLNNLAEMPHAISNTFWEAADVSLRR